METFEQSLSKDLEQIEGMLKTCKDDNLRDILNADKDTICECLNLYNTPVNRSNSATYKEIKENILSNKIGYKTVSPIYMLKQNKSIENKQLFEEFIKKNEFGLRQVYENPNTCIFFSDVKFGELGYNIYIKSLNKNYIRVYSNNKINNYSVLVHELGHAKLNLVHLNAFEGHYNCNFSEAYPNFLKLMFLDFIKEQGRTKDSFNLKYSYLNQFVTLTEILMEKLGSYSNYSSIEKSLFDYQYKLLMSDLLTMYLYNLYKKDKGECLRVLNIYINNFGLVSDNEFLKLMNINPNNFKNLRIVSEFVNNLNNERYIIKHKSNSKLTK